MYLGPLIVGTITGYMYGIVAYFCSGSLLTAFLVLMLCGVSMTTILAAQLGFRDGPPVY